MLWGESKVSLLFVLMALAIGLALFMQPAFAADVSSCQSLSSPNTVYVLTQNVVRTTNLDCFVVNAQNVTLDCQGHFIECQGACITVTNSVGSRGLYSDKNATKVMNCGISSFDAGIWFDGVTNGRITNVNVTAYYTALYLDSSSGNTLSNFNAASSGSYDYGGNQYNALRLGSSSNNIISNFTAASNAGTALYLGPGNYVYPPPNSNNNIISNFQATSYSEAIYLSSSSGNTISNFTAISNMGTGSISIHDSSYNTISRGTFSGSGSRHLSISSSIQPAQGNVFYWNNFTCIDPYDCLIMDDTGGDNFYNATINGKPEGNIWCDVMDGSAAISGANQSQYGTGWYAGSNGLGYPYNYTKTVTAFNFFCCSAGGCVDYAPLTTVPLLPTPCADENEACSAINTCCNADLLCYGTPAATCQHCKGSGVSCAADSECCQDTGALVCDGPMGTLGPRTCQPKCAHSAGDSCAVEQCCSWTGMVCDASLQCEMPCGIAGQPPVAGICCAGLVEDANGNCNAPCVPQNQHSLSPGDCCPGLSEDADGNCVSSIAPPTGMGNYGWILLAVAISAAFLGLAYMAAKLFEIQMLEAWVKIELGELATAAVIAVFCIALIATTNSAAQFLSGESGTADVAGVAQNFLRTSVYENGRGIYLELAEFYFYSARVASYTYTAGLNVGIFSTSVSQSPSAGLNVLVGQVGQGMDTVSNFMLLAAAQYSFLGFFRSAAIVMLPVGIVLRSFSLTRKIGGVVLAAVIASAVIYPAAFLLSKEIYNTYSGDMMNDAANIRVANPPGDPPMSSLVCSEYMKQFVQSPLPFIGGELGWSVTVCVPLCAATAVVGGFAACWEGCSKLVTTIFMIIKAVFSIATYIFGFRPYNELLTAGDMINSYYVPLRDFGLPAVAKYTVLSLVVFIVPLLVTMTMLRNLTVMFGGEPQLYGLSKLV